MTTKTSKLLRKVSAAHTGFIFESARATAVADIKRAIVDEKQDRKVFERDFIGGLIAYRLFADLKLADALAKGKGIAGATSQGHKPKAGQAIRTPEEETAWEAARKQWYRCAKDAGIVKARKNAATPRKGKGGKPKAGKAKPVLALKPKNAAMANTQLLNMAQMASGYCAKHKTMVCDEASHAVANFLATMAKLAK